MARNVAGVVYGTSEPVFTERPTAPLIVTYAEGNDNIAAVVRRIGNQSSPNRGSFPSMLLEMARNVARGVYEAGELALTNSPYSHRNFARTTYVTMLT
ncbi:MAG: hypothetical protein WDO73_31920 [Ignavibacteriota bacterium]